ncbi:MAG: hypothetical protein AAGE96_12525 [Cyanobacteria bacterium P01_G01_bin.19]
MLIKRHQKVCLSFISTDLPVWNGIETNATLYQKDCEIFHLLLDRQNLPQSKSLDRDLKQCDRGLFWLEISPYRIALTMQSNSRLSYRHFWEKGIYGISRYCWNTNSNESSKSMRFRNFTKYLKVEQDIYPRHVRIEYELWSDKLQLGSYIFNLDLDM